jgi:hypothetical protein
MKSEQHKALVEVPLGSDYANQIIVHREYEDLEKNRLIRNVQTYKVKEGSRLANLHEVELEKLKSPKMNRLADQAHI